MCLDMRLIYNNTTSKQQRYEGAPLPDVENRQRKRQDRHIGRRAGCISERESRDVISRQSVAMAKDHGRQPLVTAIEYGSQSMVTTITSYYGMRARRDRRSAYSVALCDEVLCLLSIPARTCLSSLTTLPTYLRDTLGSRSHHIIQPWPAERAFLRQVGTLIPRR